MCFPHQHYWNKMNVLHVYILIIITNYYNIVLYGLFFSFIEMIQYEVMSLTVCYVKLTILTVNCMCYAFWLAGQVAVSQSNKVYTWGCHPYNLRFVAHAARKARQAGKFMGDPVERFLLPEVVDTGYVHGRITKVWGSALAFHVKHISVSVYLCA